MRDITLLILAAGMGSRFGGLKQIEPVGPSGEFIIDYSIYDAIKAGFTKVVFVIKEENFEIFKETIGKRIEGKIKVEYIFQKIEDMPGKYEVPKNRIKPWGTGQAIYAARNIINEPFATITSDDFYGTEPFQLLADYLTNIPDNNEYVAIGFKIKNTLSENGVVKRGLFEEKDNKVVRFIESVVEKKNNKLIASPINSDESFEISFDYPVSMVMFGFTQGIFKLIEESLINFQERNKEDLLNCEYILTDEMGSYIKEEKCIINIKETNSKWHGVTYKEDIEKVRNDIINYINEGIYPNNLWKEK